MIPTTNREYFLYSFNQLVFAIGLPYIFCLMQQLTRYKERRKATTFYAPHDGRGWSAITRNSKIFTKYSSVTYCHTSTLHLPNDL
jgi:hypothetical protein